MTKPATKLGIFCRVDVPELLEGLALHLRTGTPLPSGRVVRGLLRRMLGTRPRMEPAPQVDDAVSHLPADWLEQAPGLKVSAEAFAAARETVEHFTDIEPDLARLSKQPLGRLPVQPQLDTPRHRAWLRLIGGIAHRYRRIIVIPWLVRGGADRVALHALRAAHEFDGPEATLLLIADYGRKDAVDWLPPGTEYRSLSDLGEELDPADRFSLVVTLIHSLQPEAVLNVNSEAAWSAFAQHGRALSGIARLYAGLFCPDYDKDMHRADYGYRYLIKCLPHLSGIYLDNAAFAAELSMMHGLPRGDRDKLRVVYQPVPGPLVATLPAGRPRAPLPAAPRVLWASRLAAQKNPTILPQIAKLAGWCRFEAFGHGDTDTLENLQRQAPENLRFRGTYASFDALRPDGFDVFLYTTLWDGVPNVLLEAGAAGLPIVAPMVGGIPELINAETGWPVNDPHDPLAYVRALTEAAKNPDEAGRRAGNLRQFIAERHSWHAFSSAFAAAPGFLSAGQKVKEADLLDA